MWQSQNIERAGYGAELIKKLSEKIGADYGKGYTETNLKYMRLFYSHFQIRHALRDELSWNNQVFASKYKTFLPTEEELQQELNRELKIVETENQMENK
ncbi:DUF1016 N-terminal domain-containing protein [Pedobacter heparinus]|uniref:YhcG N-terminal domain-containing protein n=1 Tax=Pedobacter heparinus (strain ATCC 13125 / DSM 2366 / CIP 104194 / JCM 7457 / NBRC 12017 / NCIMB 9290 / NRRL B-14731 / HIM 762-3) TaxID=485917 RepID=C6XVF5_PEDHD|nr:DUF1016 N-terminal domain-containing protein [Pedobacter heparinus]ACU04021.1 conserved hypothetical protein [Pedobacter heparinus DSM 2366]